MQPTRAGHEPVLTAPLEALVSARRAAWSSLGHTHQATSIIDRDGWVLASQSEVGAVSAERADAPA